MLRSGSGQGRECARSETADTERSSVHEQDERRQAATPRDRGARAASATLPDGEHPHAASGGERYQTAHREHAVEQQGRATDRSARGTGPSVRRSQAPSADVRAGQSSDSSGPAGSYPAERAADVTTVRPHPDDEAQLTDRATRSSGAICSRGPPNTSMAQTAAPSRATPRHPGPNGSTSPNAARQPARLRASGWHGLCIHFSRVSDGRGHPTLSRAGLLRRRAIHRGDLPRPGRQVKIWTR